MSTELLENWRKARYALFPVRQIYLRTGARVRFVRLGSRVQLGLASVLFGVIVWSVFASYTYIFTDQRILSRDYRIDEITGEYNS